MSRARSFFAPDTDTHPDPMPLPRIDLLTRSEATYGGDIRGPFRYARVEIGVERCASAGLRLAWCVAPEQIPERFRGAVYRGIVRGFLPRLSSAGPLKVRVIGGSWHESESDEASFERAALSASVRALRALRATTRRTG